MSPRSRDTATAEGLDAVPALMGHGHESDRGQGGRFTDLRQLDEVPGLAGRTDGVVEAVCVSGDEKVRARQPQPK